MDSRTVRISRRFLAAARTDRGLGAAYEVDEWLVTGAGDVTEVIDWASAKAAGRTYTLYAVHDRGDERGLIHLFGVDPTVGP